MYKYILPFALSLFLFACNSGHDHSAEGHDHGHDHDTETEEVAVEETKTEGDEWEEITLPIEESIYRGAKIDEAGAIEPSAMLALMGESTEIETKIITEIKSCCQKKGCWMKVDLADGEEMRVTFKDYGFFVPKNSAGLKVVMDGRAYYDTTSVEMLRHYAEDAGMSQEEIDAITEPELELAFESEGLILLANK